MTQKIEYQATSCAYSVFEQDICSSKYTFVATRFLGEGKNTYLGQVFIFRFSGTSMHLVPALYASQKDHSTLKIRYADVAQCFGGISSTQIILHPV